MDIFPKITFELNYEWSSGEDEEKESQDSSVQTSSPASSCILLSLLCSTACSTPLTPNPGFPPTLPQSSSVLSPVLVICGTSQERVLTNLRKDVRRLSEELRRKDVLLSSYIETAAAQNKKIGVLNSTINSSTVDTLLWDPLQPRSSSCSTPNPESNWSEMIARRKRLLQNPVRRHTRGSPHLAGNHVHGPATSPRGQLVDPPPTTLIVGDSIVRNRETSVRTVRKRYLTSEVAANFIEVLDKCPPVILPASCSSVVEDFNSKLKSSLDSVAPLKTKLVQDSHITPWRNEEIKKLKRNYRIAERRWRKNKLTINYQIFHEQLKIYNNALRHARNTYFANIINNHKNNPRVLFSTIDLLINPDFNKFESTSLTPL
ncbi:hypothetical protein ABVT39_025993 [Epinephelus coioides]